MRRIVFLDRAMLAPGTVLRPPAFPHEWVDHPSTTGDPAVVAARIAGADIVVSSKVPLRAALLERHPSVRMIAVAGTGTDHVDVDWCRDQGLTVANVSGYAAASVAEHTLALILALRRSLPGLAADLADGQWQRAGVFCLHSRPIGGLAGARLGLVGRGAIGGAVAALARAFGMDVVFAGRRGATAVEPGTIPFAEMLATSDVISLHCPLTPETRGLVGEAEFRAMARRPLLINTARGGLVDEVALVRAFDHGRIAGAGFDVAATEPPPDDSPLLSLLGRPEVIVTPHVAWASAAAMQALADGVIDNIEAFVAGGG